MDAPATRDGARGPLPPEGGDAGGKWAILLAVAGGILALDVLTKWTVQRSFHPGGSVEVLGDAVRLTYIFNPGAAFGLHLGEYSRPLLIVLALAALAVLGALFVRTPGHRRVRLLAIALVLGGALGNLLDRVRSPFGVVDFLDLGFGLWRWPVFNVADVGVTTGALLLAASLWGEEREERRLAHVHQATEPSGPE